MTREARFWRNVTIVGLIHLGILLGLIWWSRAPRRTKDNVIWMEGGSGPSAPAAEEAAASTPEPTPEATIEEATPEPMPTRKSEIEMASPTISASASPTPTSTPTPKPTPTPTATPRPKPKPTPKPSPKKQKPKASPTPNDKEKESERKKDTAKKLLGKEEESSEKPVKKATAAEGGEGEGEEAKAKGTGGSGGGKAKGQGGASSEFGWYANMLHDRFYSEWVQPTSVVHSAPLNVLLRIRIEKDGRISKYEIAKSSGNPVVDDSVTEAAARVKQVDALPRGLGGDYYDVKINFELQ